MLVAVELKVCVLCSWSRVGHCQCVVHIQTANHILNRIEVWDTKRPWQHTCAHTHTNTSRVEKHTQREQNVKTKYLLQKTKSTTKRSALIQHKYVPITANLSDYDNKLRRAGGATTDTNRQLHNNTAVRTNYPPGILVADELLQHLYLEHLGP